MFGTIVLLSAASAVMFVLLLAASVVRRLHDTGRTGLWGLLPLPFLVTGLWGFHALRGSMRDGQDPGHNFGLLFTNNVAYLAVIGFLVFLLARKPTTGPNRYGPDPRERRADEGRF